ncbi:hypothetical protein [Hydromonas duriensis]|uniref:Uncharacterized protein n=1 Tax=Hydromonas duriensis TaxID=1527608 RepID=A0A4R6YBM8_9BURK|nr:hypothetical protein [Hydromonas duriensis]TDR33009.1 hypothetical protein DFR44_10158 [Hydromonas duriensis]
MTTQLLSSQVKKWRDLDVAQMAFWPNTPRRLFELFGGLMLVAVLSYLCVWPKYREWQAAQQQTALLQEKYVQAVQLSDLPSRSMVPVVKTIPKTERANWLSDFALMSQSAGFRTLKVTPIYVSNEQPPIQKPSGADFVNSSRVGQVNVSGEGEYAALLKWVAALSARDDILSVDEMTVQGIASGVVQWQARIVFAAEPM